MFYFDPDKSLQHLAMEENTASIYFEFDFLHLHRNRCVCRRNTTAFTQTSVMHYEIFIIAALSHHKIYKIQWYFTDSNKCCIHLSDTVVYYRFFWHIHFYVQYNEFNAPWHCDFTTTVEPNPICVSFGFNNKTQSGLSVGYNVISGSLCRYYCIG